MLNLTVRLFSIRDPLDCHLMEHRGGHASLYYAQRARSQSKRMEEELHQEPDSSGHTKTGYIIAQG